MGGAEPRARSRAIQLIQALDLDLHVDPGVVTVSRSDLVSIFSLHS
jgi:hypothetical protein